MFGGGVAGLVVGHAQQCQLDLEGRCPNEACKLVLRLNFLWHQIEQCDAQRADVLTRRLILIHHMDALTGEDVISGQA